ncbi:hypothetical protein [Microbacterium sp. NPDC087665]|uniref:hypothetical protein n=1 Tax=Microbacterium sp. NPDC087665 TaxID=3364194 RepID=UPI0037F21C5D
MTFDAWLMLIIAVVAASGGWAANKFGRLARVESRLIHVETVNRRMWLHMRAQVDHAYRSGYMPLPIPADLFGEEEDK